MHGVWTWTIPQHGGDWNFEVAQTFQAVKVQAMAANQGLLVRATRLRGREIKMLVTGLVGGTAWNHFFKGTIDGDRISGEVLVSDGGQQRTFPWIANRKR